MSTHDERRRHAREAIRIEGTAVAGDGLIRLPVWVVNQSKSGAMVEVSQRTALPEQFVLLFRHTAEPCRLVWQQGALAGIQFMQPS
ncbi:hypothetical protein [Devosia naphthalenivorans]|uniref:hypothetical protein n=1 Tax=Devosia naphthalenivorans TaxID=2082392 RepID=UPI0013B0581B|nr:hypothetical protein [Devosia naphthalenivorans]